MDVKEKQRLAASHLCSHLLVSNALNLGMCPDHELNPQPFGVLEDAPKPIEPPARAVVVFMLQNDSYTPSCVSH